MSTDTTAPEAKHCTPECPGPSLYELAGLAPAHVCADQIAEHGVKRGAVIELARVIGERDRARSVAVSAEQRISELSDALDEIRDALQRFIADDERDTRTLRIDVEQALLVIDEAHAFGVDETQSALAALAAADPQNG